MLSKEELIEEFESVVMTIYPSVPKEHLVEARDAETGSYSSDYLRSLYGFFNAGRIVGLEEASDAIKAS